MNILDEQINLKKDFPPHTFEEWKLIVESDLKGADFNKKLITKTYEEINLNPLYTEKDLPSDDFLNVLPGDVSTIRGSGYTANSVMGWLVSQEIHEPLSEDFNSKLLHALQNGQNAISLVLDETSKAGLDADYGKVGQTGRDGVSISGLNSLKRAIKGVNLEEFPLFVDCGASSLPFMSILHAYLKTSENENEFIVGSVEADPIGFLALNGFLPLDIDKAYEHLAITTKFANKYYPGLKTAGVNTLNYVNSGATAVQELAFALAITVEYIQNLSNKGLLPEDTLSSIRYTMGTGINFFMEISKYRAFRVLFSKLNESYDLLDKNIKPMIHAVNSTLPYSKRDHHTNILRGTTQSFAAVVGGVDSLYVTPFDYVIGNNSELANRIARNTQTVLLSESHLNQVIDPAGGSYYVENLTAEIAKKSWDLFLEIEDKGGFTECLKSGFIQDSIENVLKNRIKDISTRKNSVVGVNFYANTKEAEPVKEQVDYEAVYQNRAGYLQKLRVSGSSEKHSEILEVLNNLDLSIPDLFDNFAVLLEKGVTYGEIFSASRGSLKDQINIKPVIPFRPAVIFEELILKSKSYQAKAGKKPGICLMNFGGIKQFKARADFSKGFFEPAGFEVTYNQGFSDTPSVVKAALKTDAEIFVICSTDDTYPEIVPAVFELLNDAKINKPIILAGFPKDQIESHKNSGIFEFIFLGANLPEIANKLYDYLGVN